MSALARVRTAWHVLRHGDVPAPVRDAIADEIDTDNAIVERLVADQIRHLRPALMNGGAR